RNGTERICCATCELCLGRVPTDRPTRRCYRRQRQPARSLPSTLDPRHWSAVASSSVAPPVRHHSIRSRRHAERPSPTLTRADELTTHDTSWWGREKMIYDHVRQIIPPETVVGDNQQKAGAHAK